MLPASSLECETIWRSNELIGSSNMGMGRERFISPFPNLQVLYMRKVFVQRFYGGQIFSFFSHLTFPQTFFVSDFQKLFGSMKIWTQLL